MSLGKKVNSTEAGAWVSRPENSFPRIMNTAPLHATPLSLFGLIYRGHLSACIMPELTLF